MNELPKPPETFTAFAERYPELSEAWELIGTAGRNGPLDEPTARLIKLGVAIGAMREGAVHASVRKALALGIEPAALEQVVLLAAGTVGFPGAVAAFSWVRELLPDAEGE
jgi:alkylhydroperoxidase/carboxymuconolactone decarboxylase family protein YurZ